MLRRLTPLAQIYHRGRVGEAAVQCGRRLADKEFQESAPFPFPYQGISGSPKLVAEQAKTDQSECSYRRQQEP